MILAPPGGIQGLYRCKKFTAGHNFTSHGPVSSWTQHQTLDFDLWLFVRALASRGQEQERLLDDITASEYPSLTSWYRARRARDHTCGSRLATMCLGGGPLGYVLRVTGYITPISFHVVQGSSLGSRSSVFDNSGSGCITNPAMAPLGKVTLSTVPGE